MSVITRVWTAFRWMGPIPVHTAAVNVEEITGSHTWKGKRLTHSHQRSATAFYLPAPPRQLTLPKTVPGR